jgi:hypothetical protein
MQTPLTRIDSKAAEVSLLKHLSPYWPGNYTPVWSSDVEEAMVFALESCVTNYGFRVRAPHIIVSLENNPCVIEVARRLEAQKRCTVSFLSPGHGYISVHPQDYIDQVRPNTCCICAPKMNYWTGVLCDIAGIAALRDAPQYIRKIPILSDYTGVMGRVSRLNLDKDGVDMCMVGLSQVTGLCGLAVCLVNDKLKSGFGIQPMIPRKFIDPSLLLATKIAWTLHCKAGGFAPTAMARLRSELTDAGFELLTPEYPLAVGHILLLQSGKTNVAEKMVKNKVLADTLPLGYYGYVEGLLQLSFTSLTEEQAVQIAQILIAVPS